MIDSFVKDKYKYINVNVCTYKEQGVDMLELGISQAQTQFTKLLTKTVIIVDKKAHIKKAVIMPYDEYMNLMKRTSQEENMDNGVFNQFAGLLESDFKTDDKKYNKIVN